LGGGKHFLIFADSGKACSENTKLSWSFSEYEDKGMFIFGK
jgi:hypothetical protein